MSDSEQNEQQELIPAEEKPEPKADAAPAAEAEKVEAEEKAPAPENGPAKPDSSPEETEEKKEESEEKVPAGEGEDAKPAESQEASKDSETEKKEEKAPEPEKVLPPVPEFVDLNEIQIRPLSELHKLAVEAELRVAGVRSKHQLIFELLTYYGRRGTVIEAEGVLEQEGNGYGFIRWERFSFAPLQDDVYVSPSLMRKTGLRTGLKLRVKLRVPKDKEKFFAVDEIISVEGIPYDDWEDPKHFDKLTALFPKDRLILETQTDPSVPARVVDTIAPLGKGQRGLIVAPPRGGKTLLLKDIARSIHTNYPDVELIVLLLDERPEEVTDFKETVEVPVFSSTFDESPKRHIQLSELVSERARRLVELGKDVVILLDSLTRLARGYNSTQGGGRTGSGGLGTKALIKPRKFFGAARNVEEGGSLTILATALVDTESRMDEAIFEEFKGTGNMEIGLDRELVERRVFPAIHIPKSGTRNDDKLYHPDEFKRIAMLRRELAQMPAVEAMEVLIRNIRQTGSNAELLLKGLK